MEAKHYARPAQELFDEAVAWLAKEFKIDQLPD
jgi:hypothetical protein